MTQSSSECRQQYHGESPDEVALATAAAAAGYVLHGRSGESIELIDVDGELQEFQVLAVNPFSSSRKRMSILLRWRKTGKAIVLVKVHELSILFVFCAERVNADPSLTPNLHMKGLHLNCIQGAETSILPFVSGSKEDSEVATKPRH